MTRLLEVGAWNKLPHFSVVGDKVSFYVWINRSNEPGSGIYKAGMQGASGWIKGKEAFDLYGKLSAALKRDKQQFCCMVEDIHKQHKGRF